MWFSQRLARGSLNPSLSCWLTTKMSPGEKSFVFYLSFLHAYSIAPLFLIFSRVGIHCSFIHPTNVLVCLLFTKCEALGIQWWSEEKHIINFYLLGRLHDSIGLLPFCRNILAYWVKITVISKISNLIHLQSFTHSIIFYKCVCIFIQENPPV